MARPSRPAGPADDDGYRVMEEVRLIMVGKTGVGKSAVGNSILGGKVFLSEAKAVSVTTECQRQMGYYRDGTLVSVVDTPGLYDTSLSNQQILETIAKCVVLASPGPHAILLVLQIGRFTPEERDAVRQLQELLGDGAAQYTIVVFTRKEELEDKSIEDYIDEADEHLKSVVQSCGNRYVAFNNKAHEPEQRKQLRELFAMIQRMGKQTGGSWYTSEMFEQAQEAVRRREQEITEQHRSKGRVISKPDIREEAERHVMVSIIDACKRLGASAMQSMRDVGARLKQIFSKG